MNGMAQSRIHIVTGKYRLDTTIRKGEGIHILSIEGNAECSGGGMAQRERKGGLGCIMSLGRTVTTIEQVIINRKGS